METKNILVTGGAGFIGSHMSKALASEGHSVSVIDSFNDYYRVQLKRDRLESMQDKIKHVYEFDLNESEKLTRVFEKERFDQVIHLAAQPGVRYSLEAPFKYERRNSWATLALYEACRNAGVNSVVLAGSSSVYGNREGPFKETDRPMPASLYACTKLYQEQLAQTYHRLFGINTTTLRFFTVYGPWGRPDMAYWKFIEKIERGEVIKLYGFGELRRDFTYVSDIVKGIVAASKKDRGYELFNLGASSPVVLHDFVRALEKVTGKRANVELVRGPKTEVKETYADISKARKVLGYEPEVSIEEGLAKFYEWWKGYTNK